MIREQNTNLRVASRTKRRWFVLALLVLAGGGSVAQTPDGPSPLTGADCDRLYEHQRSVLKRDSSHPLAPAFATSLEAFDTPASVNAQREYCVRTVTRPVFACQLSARTLRELLDCQSPAAPARTPQTPAAPPKKPPAAQVPASGEKPAEQIATLTVRVNRDTCTRAYGHMLGVYENSPELNQLSNKKKLLEHWRGEAARGSFINRCLKQFRATDLGCLLSTADPDVIQACLLEVPE